ncbi:hypothetical protein CsSME_00044685 [Camellia sinensis var. sinensis]
MAARSVFRSNERAARTQGRERRKEMIEWLIQREGKEKGRSGNCSKITKHEDGVDSCLLRMGACHVYTEREALQS